MDRDRLRSIVRSGPPPARAGPVRELTYEPVDADGLPVDGARGLPAFDGATTVGTPFGEVLLIEHVIDPGTPHGAVTVEDCDLADPDALGVLTGRPFTGLESRGRSPVFFDLETTGLSGGAGTVAFLAGCGTFEGGAFRTRQFFLQGFAAERALLHAVAEVLGDAAFLVTYNGRTFDMPVMEMRWLFHRMTPLDAVPHVDMLPPARRLWREAVDGPDRSCRLVALEEALLGFTRVDDVPGWEIPHRYFDYVRRGDPGPLEPVLRHNRLDLVSLAVLTARAQRLVREGHTAGHDARECVALGRLYLRAGRMGQAEACFEAAADHPVGDRAAREDGLRELALIRRRQRRHPEAAAAWNRLLALGHGRSPRAREAIEALAVHHEHRERNLESARRFALQALQAEADPMKREAVRHRLARLERKLQRPLL